MIKRELLERLKQSGSIEIKYGVKSESQYILNSIDKGITIEQIKNVFYLTSSVGIKILKNNIGNFIYRY